MDWKRRWGLEFWYFAEEQNAPLKTVLKKYEKAVEDGQAADAVPWYQEDRLGPSDHKDSLYYLLAFRADNTVDNTWRVLAPKGNTCDELDYRMAWHLWTVLEVGLTMSSPSVYLDFE